MVDSTDSKSVQTFTESTKSDSPKAASETTADAAVPTQHACPRAVAEKLGFVKQGTTTVKVEILQ